jgi:sulfur-carrier protein
LEQQYRTPHFGYKGGMVQIEFANSFRRHTQASRYTAHATSVRAALEAAFDQQPMLRGYVLDDQGKVRPHITIFVNDHTIADRDTQQDVLNDDDTVFVYQALSGG